MGALSECDLRVEHVKVVDALRKFLPSRVVVQQQVLFSAAADLGQRVAHVVLQKLLRLLIELVRQGLGVGHA